MNGRKMILVGAALAVALLLATNAEAQMIGFLEQISPTPTVYNQGLTPIDPAPPGIDFSTAAADGFPASGDVTADVQYVPGDGCDLGGFEGAGFVAGNIALIDRGTCQFDLKVNSAADAGAVGVIIANTFPSSNGGLLTMGFTVPTTIPAVMVRYDLGQEFIASAGAGTLNVHMNIREPNPNPAYALEAGMWNTRIIAIDDQNGATDHDIDTTTEALAILDYANGGPNTGGWNIRYDVGDNRNLVDMAGGVGTFASDHPYPNGESEPDNSPGVGEDFLVTAETRMPVFIPEGDWTIGFGSDDGGALQIPGVVFSNEINTNGDPGLDDTLFYDAPRGHDWTTGEFTVGPGGMTVDIEAIMYERAGGDSFEIAIAQGHTGNLVINDVERWHTLQDGTLGWEVIPEPSTLALCGLALIGLLAVGRRR